MLSVSGRAVLLVILALAATLMGCGADLTDPVIEAILPAQGAAGAAVDVIGLRFEGKQRFVSFGGELASVLMWQEERVRVFVPQASPGHTVVVVTVEGRPSNAADFIIE